MTIAVISDTHISSSNDKAHQLVLDFLANDKVQEAETIVLLGDIFDVMVGPHVFYWEKYPLIFEKIEKFLNEGKEIYFFEGNHDFHLEKLFKQRFSQKRFHYIKDEFILNKWGKSIYFSHGDNLDKNNIPYQMTKAILRNRFFEAFVEYLPLKVVHFLGSTWSEKSRKNNSKYFLNELLSEKIRLKFRKSANELSECKKFDYIICGHSHVEENHQFKNNCFYLNNGFPQISRKFIFLEEKGHSLQRLP